MYILTIQTEIPITKICAYKPPLHPGTPFTCSEFSNFLRFFSGFQKSSQIHTQNSRWWFQICFMFIPIWGKDPIDEHMFQMGWFNHQLEWCAPNGICFPSSCVQREAYRQSINRNIYVNMSPLNRGFPHLRQVGECKGKPFKSLIGFDELFFYPPKGSMWRGYIFTYSKNHWTLRIWGVWMCVAGVWDLQTTSFEIPWFLGYIIKKAFCWDYHPHNPNFFLLTSNRTSKYSSVFWISCWP